MTGLVYVAAEYNEKDLSRVKRLKFICTLQTEHSMALQTGKTITLGRKPYVLGERFTMEDNIIHYDLTPAKK